MYSPAEKRSGAIADVVLSAGNPAQHSKASALGPIAYIVSRYPLLTETFILREMLELERTTSSSLAEEVTRLEAEIAVLREAAAGTLSCSNSLHPFITRPFCLMRSSLQTLRS